MDDQKTKQHETNLKWVMMILVVGCVLFTSAIGLAMYQINDCVEKGVGCVDIADDTWMKVIAPMLVMGLVCMLVGTVMFVLEMYL